MTRTKPIPFAAACSGRFIKGDYCAGRSTRQALLIHGAGSSERGRFAALRCALHGRGIGTTVFDCVGHGETGGSVHESSLGSRTRQAEAVIDSGQGPSIQAVVGTSMGAYNAIKLLETRKLEALVLVVPGVYTPAAYELPFGDRFTALIRQQRSWDKTDAWDILAEFNGRLLVITAEHDTVIPSEIPERLLQAAKKSSWRKLHVVQGAQHERLFPLLSQRAQEFEQAMVLISSCLQAAD